MYSCLFNENELQWQPSGFISRALARSNLALPKFQSINKKNQNILEFSKGYIIIYISNKVKTFQTLDSSKTS
jgi:hypothetical protein